MKILPVCTAALFQLLGYSLFIMQPEDQCSPAPPLGSFIFLLATGCFLSDINIYPCRYMHMAKHWRLLIELVASIFLTEILTLIIWCGVERVIFMLTRQLLHTLNLTDCDPVELGYWLQGLSTIVVSGALLWFILEATDTIYSLKSKMRKIKRNWHQLWLYLNRIRSMNSSQRRRALKACNLAMFSSRRQRCKPEEEMFEDDDD